MEKATVAKWVGALLCVLLVLVLASVSYRAKDGSLLFSVKEALAAPVSRQCRAHTIHLSKYRHRLDNPDSANNAQWNTLDLRLNTSEAGIFPFPKFYSSAPSGDAVQLELAEDFEIITSSPNTGATGDMRHERIFSRYCGSTTRVPRDPALQIQTVTVHRIEVTYSSVNLLATSAAMQEVLQQRSAAERENAHYIDEEMYALGVSADGNVRITVHSPALYKGSHRGIANSLASLDQLLQQVVPLQLPMAILDWPDNHWRGLSLDVARHFIPVAQLKRQIAALAASKYDTLHLHLTDSQSFPVLLDDTVDGLPLSNLARKGAFGPDKLYTKADLRELVVYADGYGMEVVPEIDMPAHALSWGAAFEHLIVRCKTVAGAAQTPHNIYPLDPSNPLTYKVMRAILSQIAEIFPSKYLHIGGDEVEERCWGESVELMKWARERNLTVHGITGYFEQQVVDATYALNKVPILWQGIIDSRSMPPIPVKRNSTAPGPETNASATRRSLSTTPVSSAAPDTTHTSASVANASTPQLEEPAIVQPWKCWGGLALRSAMTALHSGHPVVMSACWYLDYTQEWSSYLATDLAASARASAAAASSSSVQAPGRPHSRGLQHEERRVAVTGGDAGSAEAIRNGTTPSPEQLEAAARLASLTPIQKMYLSLTELDDPDTSSAAPGASGDLPQASAPAAPQLHSNYFLPGGEASMWLERVDCSNLECRLWPRAGAVAARLWGLGATFESVSYYGATEGAEQAEVRHAGQHSNRRHTQANRGGQRTSGRHRPQPHTQSMALNLPQTVQLYATYIRFRYYLEESLGMSPAGLVLHYPLRCAGANTAGAAPSGVAGEAVPPQTPQQQALCHAAAKRKTPNMIYSEEIGLELQAYSRIQQLLRVGVEMSSNSNSNNHIPDGALRITAQCMGTPEEVQRPLSVPGVSAVQLNVGDGSTGTRGKDMLSWLQTQANRGVLFVGFCELNGWQDLESLTELPKNRAKIVYRAANAGFSYSHVMVNSQPYNLGIVSARPFTVLGEYGPPAFQRGVLHVYFAAVQLHVFVVHLHAHSSQQRIAEAHALVQILKPHLEAGERVALMGDFNTLSRHDSRQHEDAQLPQMLRRTDLQLFARLRKKYMIEGDAAGGIQYAPMDILLGAGMRDACVEACLQETSTVDAPTSSVSNIINDTSSAAAGDSASGSAAVGLPTWSTLSRDPFSLCMQRRCAATEPTKYNPEWPLQNDSHPYIRLDFILLSESILRPVNVSTATYPTATAARVPLRAGVDSSNVTEVLSDHFPVYASWGSGDGVSVPLS